MRTRLRTRIFSPEWSPPFAMLCPSSRLSSKNGTNFPLTDVVRDGTLTTEEPGAEIASHKATFEKGRGAPPRLSLVPRPHPHIALTLPRDGAHCRLRSHCGQQCLHLLTGSPLACAACRASSSRANGPSHLSRSRLALGWTPFPWLHHLQSEKWTLALRTIRFS